MSTTVVYRLFLVALAAGGAFLLASGVELRYWGTLGPGAGFFPIWVGGLLAGVALVALARSVLARGRAAPFFAERDGARRLAFVVAALAALWLGLAWLGFRLAMLLFLLLVPHRLGPHPTAVRIVVAMALSFGVAALFERILGVALPAPAVDALTRLGL